jgi:murein DD-endopeptidase MepM/ murein hydrolase activator NlpD
VLRRAHDGVDIYARKGVPVVAPVAGVVIDPAKRWKPWRRDRYGLTVVIESTEPTSRGYAFILAHLDRVDVRIGATVRRGHRIGTNGNTGNAAATPAHIHFEIRAPFTLRFRELGRVRELDAFNPWHSIRRADPRFQ